MKIAGICALIAHGLDIGAEQPPAPFSGAGLACRSRAWGYVAPRTANFQQRCRMVLNSATASRLTFRHSCPA